MGMEVPLKEVNTGSSHETGLSQGTLSQEKKSGFENADGERGWDRTQKRAVLPGDSY